MKVKQLLEQEVLLLENIEQIGKIIENVIYDLGKIKVNEYEIVNKFGIPFISSVGQYTVDEDNVFEWIDLYREAWEKGWLDEDFSPNNALNEFKQTDKILETIENFFDELSFVDIEKGKNEDDGKIRLRPEWERQKHEIDDILPYLDSFTIVEPLTFAASVRLGRDTQWCISNNPDKVNHEEISNKSEHWKSYKKEGYDFLFIFNKILNPPYDKIAIVRSGNEILEIRDKKDNYLKVENFYQIFEDELSEERVDDIMNVVQEWIDDKHNEEIRKFEENFKFAREGRIDKLDMDSINKMSSNRREDILLILKDHLYDLDKAQDIFEFLRREFGRFQDSVYEIRRLHDYIMDYYDESLKMIFESIDKFTIYDTQEDILIDVYEIVKRTNNYVFSSEFSEEIYLNTNLGYRIHHMLKHIIEELEERNNPSLKTKVSLDKIKTKFNILEEPDPKAYIG